MQSIVNELAHRLNLPPAQVESAIGDLLIKVRAALETIGEAEVGGLGTFRSIDGKVTFSPAPSFAEAVNRDFAGMKPVALTSTGESVAVDDERAIPGSDASFEEPIITRTVAEELAGSLAADSNIGSEDVEGETYKPSLDDFPVPKLPDEPDWPQEEPVVEDEPVAESSFSSPPPPVPSKVRVPPGERRQMREHRRRTSTSSGSASTEEFPDMGSVVSTRPVEPIRAAAPQKKRRNPKPVAIAAVVVIVAFLSWLVIGGGDDGASDQPAEKTTASLSAPSEKPAQETQRPAEPANASNAPSGQQSMAESVSAAMREAARKNEVVDQPAPEAMEEANVAPSEEVIDLPVDEPEPAAVAAPAEEAAAAASNVATPAAGATYVWIVGSYPSRSEADARVETLRAASFDAQVYEATVRGRAVFRVGVGRFDSEASALNSRGVVPAEVKDAWVRRVD